MRLRLLDWAVAQINSLRRRVLAQEELSAAIVDELSVERVVFTFNSPINPWPLPHGRGKYPTSTRTLIRLNGSTELFEVDGRVEDTDFNNSSVTWGANYEGQAILEF